MKILLLQDDFPPYAKGGAGIVAASLAEELAKEHEVSVITSVQDKSLAGSFQEKGIHIERVYSNYAQRWRAWRSLYNPSTAGAIKKLLKEINPDVVHAHNVHYHLSYWSLRLAKQNGAKVFLTAHDVMLFHYGKLTENAPKDCDSPRSYRVSALQQFRRYRFWYNPVRNSVIRQLLKNVDRIFAVSEELKKALQQNGIHNVEVIHNGIDVDAWSVPQEIVQKFIDSRMLNGKKVVLFGGRISASKGGEVALAAMRAVVEKEPKAVLMLLGKPDAYVKTLLAKAKEWGIEENVACTGWLSGNELKAAYHAAQIVLVPSLYLDPLPTVVLEAMACGKPVVGSCFGGVPEMVVNGKTGRIVNPFNTEQVAAAVLELISNHFLCREYGSAGIECVSREFSSLVWKQCVIDAYAVSYD